MDRNITDKQLIELALEARKLAYAPYSKFQVGAALLAENGTVYTGCNVENAAYGPSNCAERTAIFKAVSEGVRAFSRIAVAGGKEKEEPADYVTPCGVCRQVMAEFCNKETFQIIAAKSGEDYVCYTLAELFPHGFGKEDI